jgi:RNA polymerase sigma-70 factor (ECF subfamily)
LLDQVPAADNAESALFDRELKRELFHRAAKRIREEFRETTWLAFWRTCVEGQSIPTVADQLGVEVGIVYISRSRVMARLKKEVQTETS